MIKEVMIFGHDKDPKNYPGRFPTSVFMQEGFELESMEKDTHYTLVTDDDGLMDLYFLIGITNKIWWMSSCLLRNKGIYLPEWKEEMGF